MPEQTLLLQIILEKPVAGILYGVQKGSGNNYETLQKQLSGAGDLEFHVSLPVKENKDGRMVLHGPIVQKSSTEKFLYLDIGSYAGQANAPASGRLKVPLPEMDEHLVEAARNGSFLLTTISGTKGKDGSPHMGTAKPFNGWTIRKA